MSESSHTYEWIAVLNFPMSHVWMCDMTHTHVWHDSMICIRDKERLMWDTQRVHTCDTHVLILGPWLIYMCDMTQWYIWENHTGYPEHSYVWDTNIYRGPWRIHLCDNTHSYVWHDSIIYIGVKWRVMQNTQCRCTNSWVRESWYHADRSASLHIHVWHASFIRVTWPIHECDMWKPTSRWKSEFTIHTRDTPCWHVWRDPFIPIISVTCESWQVIVIQIFMCDMLRSYVSHNISLVSHVNVT